MVVRRRKALRVPRQFRDEVGLADADESLRDRKHLAVA